MIDDTENYSMTSVPTELGLAAVKNQDFRMLALYFYMATYPDTYHFSVDRLARSLQWSTTSVRNALGSLVEYGYLSREPDRNPNKKHNGFLYRIRTIHPDEASNEKESHIKKMELAVPDELKKIFTSTYAVNAMESILDTLDADEYRYMLQLTDSNMDEYKRILTDTYSVVIKKRPNDLKKYMKAVLQNKIADSYRRNYRGRNAPNTSA